MDPGADGEGRQARQAARYEDRHRARVSRKGAEACRKITGDLHGRGEFRRRIQALHLARGRRAGSRAGARACQFLRARRRDRRADRTVRLRQNHGFARRHGARSRQWRPRHGGWPRRARLLPWLSAMQNVMFGLEMKGMRGVELRDTAEKYLELVGLADSRNRRPHQLSGGMKQRVGIARALAIDPSVLLMDEPFGALDAQTRESLQAELLVNHARTKKTILFVTHDLDEAVLIADRIVVMNL